MSNTFEENKEEGTPLTSERVACMELCKGVCPEYAQKVYDWFDKNPEYKFSFGIGTATDSNMNIGQRPAPILSREGNILNINIGVETGLDEHTKLRIYERRKFTLTLSEL